MYLRAALFLLIFTIQSNRSAAQTIQDGSVLFISENGILTADAAVSNEGFLQNEGIYHVRRNWSSNGIYQGAGTIVLDGTQTQTFRHNGQFISILDVGNPAGILIRGKVPVRRQLLLTDGEITTSSIDTLFTETDALISGGSPGSFVNGPLHRGGRGLVEFPVGISGTYLPVSLLDVTGGNTITVLQARANYSGNIPQGVTSVSRDFFWERSNYRDAFAGSEVSLPFYDDQLDRSSAVIIGLDRNSGDFTLYDDLDFFTGSFYEMISTNAPVSEHILLLGTLEENIRDETAFYIPNVLSPNAADQDNRVIKVFGDFVEEDFSFVVYDRRGMQVFESKSLTRMQFNGWNGTSARTGDLLPQGAYVYALRARNSRNEVIERTGTLTILN
ncbi:gliding motility-associated C-terminal domain-containing protein [Fulvivirga sedimenti]|uniref:Gliding motility-associated C-terminal domain-containing protein n=1 Tax=Fulvivirga sedimenti TaxID=2879465 RepID=A0A9X1HMC0_9BACT|nr:gliding motility-associated C-terminal domain-containing protein [Fulvivirga sedimenti]MCA6074788.1 gliding motility-associated C-terminal domain-containing protein [Fulvivirga sedimenti]MCA6075965.1 gliding motility-associated C-terminal domain-containing protein [Fulvivirga sedimenti]MCA6077093.1 gliding motility-associated C-terminal domain-containing protein [Fulvivirga sedimenti]